MKYITPANGYEKTREKQHVTAKPRKQLRHAPSLPPADTPRSFYPAFVEPCSNGP